MPARLLEQVWRLAAYPFVDIFVAHTFLPPVPAFGSLRLIATNLGSLAGFAVDPAMARLG